ncbi:MAG TPA: hypothetical protein PLP42_11125 [Acidobacteriota bacterium]|nr:hypothetical protein [Acidobacteriota bacterium]
MSNNRETGLEKREEERPHQGELPAELAEFLESVPATVCETDIFRSLKAEIARAARYNFLVCLLLLRIVPGCQPLVRSSRDQTCELTHLLDSTIRATDLLGSVGKGLVAVILPHSDQDTGPRLLERLQTECLFSAFRRRTACDLRASFSVYPTDATTLLDLFRVALGRLSS